MLARLHPFKNDAMHRSTTTGVLPAVSRRPKPRVEAAMHLLPSVPESKIYLLFRPSDLLMQIERPLCWYPRRQRPLVASSKTFTGT